MEFEIYASIKFVYMLLHSLLKADCGGVGWWQNSHKLATLVGIVGKVPSRLQYVSHIHLIPLWHQQLTGPHLPNNIKVSQMAL